MTSSAAWSSLPHLTPEPPQPPQPPQREASSRGWRFPCGVRGTRTVPKETSFAQGGTDAGHEARAQLPRPPSLAAAPYQATSPPAQESVPAVGPRLAPDSAARGKRGTGGESKQPARCRGLSQGQVRPEAERMGSQLCARSGGGAGSRSNRAGGGGVLTCSFVCSSNRRSYSLVRPSDCFRMARASFSAFSSSVDNASSEREERSKIRIRGKGTFAGESRCSHPQSVPSQGAWETTLLKKAALRASKSGRGLADKAVASGKTWRIPASPCNGHASQQGVGSQGSCRPGTNAAEMPRSEEEAPLTEALLPHPARPLATGHNATPRRALHGTLWTWPLGLPGGDPACTEEPLSPTGWG